MAEYFTETENVQFKATQILSEQAFTPAECKKIIDFCRKIPDTRDFIVPGLHEKGQQIKAKYIDIKPDSIWIAQRIMDIVGKANEQFFEYNLHSLAELQFHEYNEGSFFNWHLDSEAKSRFSLRKISIHVLLTDPAEYEGGRLEWMPRVKLAAPPEQGTILLFPAFKVYRITPVKKGTNYCLTAWVHGD